MASLLAFAVCLATVALSETLDANLREKLSPTVREWVTQEAEKVRRMANPEEAKVMLDLQTRFHGQSVATADRDRLGFLIFSEALQAADHELHNFQAQLQANTGAPRPQSAPTSPTVQIGTSGTLPRSGPSSGSVIGGAVTVGPSGTSSTTSGTVPPGAMAVTPAQAAQFRTMSNTRNQLVMVLNTLAKKVTPPDSDSLLSLLK